MPMASRSSIGLLACVGVLLSSCKSGGGMAPAANTAGAAGGSNGGAGSGGAGSSAAGGVAGSLRWLGRVDTSDAAGPRFAWSGTGFVARFSGTGLAARLDNPGTFVFKVVVDGVAQPALEA